MIKPFSRFENFELSRFFFSGDQELSLKLGCGTNFITIKCIFQALPLVRLCTLVINETRD